MPPTLVQLTVKTVQQTNHQTKTEEMNLDKVTGVINQSLILPTLAPKLNLNEGDGEKRDLKVIVGRKSNKAENFAEKI